MYIIYQIIIDYYHELGFKQCYRNLEFRNNNLNELTTTTVQIGQGEGGGVPPPLSLYFPANVSNGPTLPPPTTVWSIGFTIHYPLTSLGAVFLERNYKFKPV